MSFTYKDNNLGVSQSENFFSLSSFSKNHDEPFYIYDLDGIVERFNVFKSGFSSLENNLRVHYAMKANSNKIVLSALKKEGARVDVVSLGEIKLALSCGFEPADIVFSGVGKSVKEITEALKLGIYQINIESVAELERIGSIASQLGVVAPVAVRFNPDVNPETHPYITTGFRENKFGLNFSEIPRIDDVKKKFNDNIRLQGLSIHIGSQIRNNTSFVDALEKTLKHLYLLEKNKCWNIQSLDIGGGVGIHYDNPDAYSDHELMQDYSSKMVEALSGVNSAIDIICEPGRVIVGRFGCLMTKVEYIKQNEFKNFAIVNSGMHHLMRPCLYNAQHTILPVVKVDGPCKQVLYDVVGPICESSDVVGHDRLLPELQQGDWLGVMDAGAYGFVMASHYNQHELPQEIVVQNGQVIFS